MSFAETITKYIPCHPFGEIPWDEVEALLAPTCFARMKITKQNPVFHGEGDVLAHTRMVCRELINNPEFHELPDRQKAELFLGTLLHDIGKVKTTRLEDGRWVSPNHSLTGSQIAREFLWEACGLCGDAQAIRFRETVCALIRHHTLPIHLMDREDPGRKAREVASIGRLVPDFSWKLLCMLAEADFRGRISDSIEDSLQKVQLAKMLCEEKGVLRAPYPFADSYTFHAYLKGRKVQPDQILFDDTWGEVIMLSGLPGTGKDTWIRRNRPDLPVVSLDNIRKEKGIRPTDRQGEVIQVARERARIHLRSRQPFIWNATNLTQNNRRKLINLFEQYGARVRIVYLETDRDIRMQRNRNRRAQVPEDVVGRMRRTMVPPMPFEAQTVEWVSV